MSSELAPPVCLDVARRGIRKIPDLDGLVQCYDPANRHHRSETWPEDNPTGRWRRYTYEELMQRDKANLDIFWLQDESLEDDANLPEPDEIAARDH